jgi:hypothetical protein
VTCTNAGKTKNLKSFETLHFLHWKIIIHFKNPVPTAVAGHWRAAAALLAE